MVKVDKPVFQRLGDISFFAIAIISAYSAFAAVQNDIVILVLGLLGAVIAIENIRRKDDVNFLVAVTGLVVVTSVLALLNLPQMAVVFLGNLLISFAVAGFIVAMGLILKLGWKE